MTTLTTSDSLVEANQEGIVAEAVDSNGLKFCADCKHLLGIRHKTYEPQNWKCVHPNNVVNMIEEYDLVTGIKKYIRVYKVEDIYKLRQEPYFCGSNGKWFELYERPEYKAAPTIGGQEAKEFVETFDSETLEANRKAAEAKVAAIKAKKLKPNDLANL